MKVVRLSELRSRITAAKYLIQDVTRTSNANNVIMVATAPGIRLRGCNCNNTFLSIRIYISKPAPRPSVSIPLLKFHSGTMNQIDLGLGLEGTHVLITGAGGLIGSRVVSAFLKADCRVSALDYDDRKLSALKTTIGADNGRLTCHVADISSEKSLNQGFHNARNAFGIIDCCVALASLDLSILDQHKSIIDLPFQQFKKTVDVNLSGTFLTAKLWLQQFVSAQSTNKNRSLIIIGSEVGQFGARGNADYASTKSAVQGGLLQSLKADIPRISPGARCVYMLSFCVSLLRTSTE